MIAFRALLVVMFITIAAYTSVTIRLHGWEFLPVFFGDLARMTWPGQFDLDFFGFLLMSGFWMAWRHHFRPAGLALGVAAVFGGMPLLSAYLLVTSFAVRGDVNRLLLGPERAKERNRIAQ